MISQELLKYKCEKDKNIEILVLHAMSSLNVMEDNPLIDMFDEQFDRYYKDIKFLGDSWQKINEKFQDHLIDCIECRKIYLRCYKGYTSFIEGYKTASILSEAKKLIKNETKV